MLKEQRAHNRDYHRLYPGLETTLRETYRLAVKRSHQTGLPVEDPIVLFCRGMERYLTGAYCGDLVQSDTSHAQTRSAIDQQRGNPRLEGGPR